MPDAPLKIVVSHSGFYADGRPNLDSILIADIEDTGEKAQNQKVPVYVPAGGSVSLSMSTSVMFSYAQGAIDRLITAGLITAFLEPTTGVIDSDAVQGPPFDNDGAQNLLHTLTIPANTLRFGDLLRLHYLVEVTSLISGEVRLLVWLGPVGGGLLVNGYFPVSVVAVHGLEFVTFSVIDDGGGLSSARLAGGFFSGVDVGGVDTTQDITLNFTAQATIASVGNTYRSTLAHLSRY